MKGAFELIAIPDGTIPAAIVPAKLHVAMKK